MSDHYEIVQLYCEGRPTGPHPRTPAGVFHRRPGEDRWHLSGMDRIWPPPPVSPVPAALAAGPRSVRLEGDTPVPISAPRSTRTKVYVQCPQCAVRGDWHLETVQSPLTATIAAVGRPVGQLTAYPVTRLAEIPLRVLDRAVQLERRGAKSDTPTTLVESAGLSL